jgi:hypothetical protein
MRLACGRLEEGFRGEVVPRRQVEGGSGTIRHLTAGARANRSQKLLLGVGSPRAGHQIACQRDVSFGRVRRRHDAGAQGRLGAVPIAGSWKYGSQKLK